MAVSARVRWCVLQSTGQIAPSLVSAPTVGRRKVLFAVFAAAVLMVGAFLVVHGSGSGNPKHARHHVRPVVASCPAHSRPRHGLACAAVHPRVRKPTVKTAMRLYAAALLPVLDRTRVLFDGVARSVASSGSMDTLGQTCLAYSPQVQVSAAEIEGVPHPYLWFTQVGTFHHRMMGIYHQVQGALSLCSTAADNQDTGAAATAVADVATGASDLRALDDNVRWLATH